MGFIFGRIDLFEGGIPMFDCGTPIGAWVEPGGRLLGFWPIEGLAFLLTSEKVLWI